MLPYMAYMDPMGIIMYKELMENQATTTLVPPATFVGNPHLLNTADIHPILFDIGVLCTFSHHKSAIKPINGIIIVESH